MTVVDLAPPRLYGELDWVEAFDTVPSKFRITGTPDMMLRLKRLFPRASKERSGHLNLAATSDVARDIDDMVLRRWPLKVTTQAERRLRILADEHRRVEQTVHEVLNGSGEVPDTWLQPARPPRPYQDPPSKLVWATRGLLLVDDLGLGKTMSGLLMVRDPRALPLLVVCPTHLDKQWLGELAVTFPMLRGHILRTTTPYVIAKHRTMHGYDPDVIIATYSKLAGWADYLAGRVRGVVFDEIQELRIHESQKYVAAAQIADQATLAMGLTATPVYNYGGEIYNVINVLSPDRLGTREEFVREWGVGDRAGHVKIEAPDALGEFLRSEGIMLRRTRKDVGKELPPVQRIVHDVDTDHKQLDALIAETRSLAELIVSKAPGLHKERFKASRDLDWKLRQATGIAKAPYVAEFVRMLLDADDDRKVVMFGWHRAVYEIWLERLKEYRPVLYTGSESSTQKERSKLRFLWDMEQIRTFNEGRPREQRIAIYHGALDGESRVLIMSNRSGAGLDGLQKVCGICVFGELDWSPGMHEQCIGRLNRDGMDEDNPVEAFFLVSDDGTDPLMSEVLQLKRQQSEPLINPGTDADLFDVADDDGDRVRRLAARVLERRRGK